MAQLGRINHLYVVKSVDFGVYVDGENLGEILVPSKWLPKSVYVGMELTVFLYKDSEDRLIGTTQCPYAQVGECAALQVVSTGTVGAFLDWGLEKDLLLPYKEQRERVREGQRVVVWIYIDRSDRIAASSRIEKFLPHPTPDRLEPYRQLQQAREGVPALIYAKTPLGYKGVVNSELSVLFFKNNEAGELKIGDRVTAYVQRIREGGAVDAVSEKPGYEKIEGFAEALLARLKKAGGFLPFNDQSDPKAIVRAFGISKKSFKKAIGALYKARKIEIRTDGIAQSAASEAGGEKAAVKKGRRRPTEGSGSR